MAWQTINQEEEQINTFSRPEKESAFFEKLDRILTGWKCVEVRSAKDSLAYSDVRKKQIHINYKKVEKESKDYLDYLKTLKGFNYHELAHLLFTTTNYYSLNFKDKDAFNILEDASVENRFGILYPKAFIYFRKAILEFIVKNTTIEEELFALLYGRRLYIKKELIDYFETKFKKQYGEVTTKRVKEIIDEFMRTDINDMKISLSKELATLLDPNHMSRLSKASSQYSSMSSNGKTSKTQEKMTKSLSEKLEKLDEKRGKEEKKQEESSKETTQEKGSEEENKEETIKNASELVKEYEQEQNVEKQISEIISKEEEKINEDTFEDIKSIIGEEGCNADSSDFEGQNMYIPYTVDGEVRVVSKRLETTIRKWKTDTRAIHKTKEKSGRLDIRQAMNMAKNPSMRIFKNYKGSVVDKTRIAVAILLDESGSVNPTEYNLEIGSAWAITNALEKTDSKVTVYGFTSGTKFKAHKKFNSKGEWARTFYGNTEPSYCIETACKMLRAYAYKEKIKNKFLIVISDGNYWGHSIGWRCEREKDFMNRVAHSHGINTLEIMIHANYDEKEGIRGYQKNIGVRNFKDLQNTMVKYIQEHQIKIIKNIMER